MDSHGPDEDGLERVPRSFFGLEFESGPHMNSFDWDRLRLQRENTW